MSIDPLSDLPTEPPKNAVEFRALLGHLKSEVDNLAALTKAVFPNHVPTDMSGWTFEQKMAYGEALSDRLGEIAFKNAPELVLDALEPKLDGSNQLGVKLMTQAAILTARGRDPAGV